MLEKLEVVGFENIKKSALSKLDKSKKGSIDKRILKVLDKINAKENYFTNSSCSGRIVLLKQGKRKDKCEWVYVSHDLADKEEMWEKLMKSKGNICLRVESMILHISCRALDDADKLLKLSRKIYKRAGIMSIKKLSIEIMGSDFLEVPLMIDNKLIVEKEYFDKIVKEANKKIKTNWKKTKEFEKLIEGLLIEGL